MTQDKALVVQKEIETILREHGIHYKVEHVRTEELKFINLEVSIKITK